MGAWIFYWLTAFKRPDSFGQVVQALIFTFAIHIPVYGVGKLFIYIGSAVGSFGVWDSRAETIWSFVFAIAVGLIACFIANNDKLHGWLRNKSVTRRTSYPSEWYSAFSKHQRYVVLNLVDERRIYGWPLEWPTEPSQGQFVLTHPAWLKDDGTEIPMIAELFVIEATKVEWVEFTPKTWS